MKLTLNWLKRHISFVNLPIEELLNRIEVALIKNAVEMEFTFVNPILQVHITHVQKLEGLKVQMCTVDLTPFSWLKNPNQILCGAENARSNMYALLAPLGTSIHGNVINERKIKNHTSYGMLLSAFEAGMESSGDGLIEMPVQSGIHSYDDVLLDLKGPFNRGDLRCARGIARVLAMESLGTVKPLALCHDSHIDFPVKVTNHTPYAFTFGYTKNIQVNEDVLQLMKLVGKSSTNLQALNDFAIMDIGHPIGIYDADNIQSLSLEEKDNKSVVLRSENEELAMVGVKNIKGYDKNTKNVIIEAAFLPSVCIPNLSTESAYRFWLGIDETQMTLAYISTLFTGQKSRILYLSGQSLQSNPIRVPLSQVYSYTNLTLSAEHIINMLSSRGFTCELIMDTPEDRLNGIVSLKCICPSWRKDIYLPVHIVQEIFFAHGYKQNNEPVTVLSAPFIMDFATTVKTRLTTFGYSEVISLPFSSRGEVKISNPMSEQEPYLRNSLLEGLLKYTETNQWQNKYFTYDSIFCKDGEHIKLGILLKGSSNRDWRRQSTAFSFFDLKEVVENLGTNLTLNEGALPNFCSYGLTYQQGYIGKIKASISANTYYAEITLEPIKNSFELVPANTSYYDVNVEGEFSDLMKQYKDFYLFDVVEKNGKMKFGITVKKL